MKEFVKIFDITPVPASRPRVTFNGTYYPKRHREFQKAFKALVGTLKRPREPLESNVALTIMFEMPMPKHWSNKKRSEMNMKYHTSRPDTSNMVKIVEDCLNGIWFKDDSQICSLYATKHWAYSGKITVTMKEV